MEIIILNIVMKKIFTGVLFVVLLGITGCQNSEESNVKEFGLNFAEMVINNDTAQIKRVYPDLGTYSVSHLSYHRDEIDIFKEQDGNYKVRFGDGGYIIVKPGLNGAMEIVDSKGIFEKEMPKAEKEKKEEAPVKKEPKKLINNSLYPIAPGSYTFTGKAEGKYPIIVYLTVDSYGDVRGKMAYKSTLKKYGNSSDHYMYMDGYFEGRYLYLDVDGGEENWSVKVSDNGYKYKLNGSAYNYKHMKSFSINVSGD